MIKHRQNSILNHKIYIKIVIKAIKYVDEVVPQVDKDKLGTYLRLEHKFNKMFVGSDWQGTPQWLKYEEQFKPYGVEIVYLPHTDGISSSQLRETLKAKE